MIKTVFYLSGIQRSGSTLLTKLLNQNSAVFASNTSPLFDYLFASVEKLEELKRTSSAAHYINADAILQASMDAFYSFTDRPYIVDKHRAWASNYHNVHKQISPNPKMIVTLRPVEEVAASFHVILEKNGTPLPMSQIYKDFLEEHVPTMIDAAQSVDYFCLVTYDELTKSPLETLRRVEAYLEIPSGEYQLNNIVDKDPENDVKWGIKNLHTVRSSLTVESTPPSELMTKAELQFFQQLTAKMYKAYKL